MEDAKGLVCDVAIKGKALKDASEVSSGMRRFNRVHPLSNAAFSLLIVQCRIIFCALPACREEKASFALWIVFALP